MLKFLKKNYLFILISIFVFLFGLLVANVSELLDLLSDYPETLIVEKTVYMPDESYLQLDRALKKIASRTYDEENYNCMNFSLDLQRELRKIGIEAKIKRGEYNGRRHAWVSIWIEPQEGRFIKPDENYLEELKIY